MLTFKNIKDDLALLAGTTTSQARSDVTEAIRIAVLNAQQRFVLHGDWSFLEQYQDTVYIPLAGPYTTGTVTVVQDSKTVTGLGTAWTNDYVGSYFQLTNCEAYEVRSVESPTSLTLCIPYQGDNAATQTYALNKRFYPLPLDFMRIVKDTAFLTESGFNNQTDIDYKEEASFNSLVQTSKPRWFSIIGNTKTVDYFNTGTVTIATSGTTSTWTISTGTLPSDIVDREVRLGQEDRTYRIKTRSDDTSFITYETYVNPSTKTNTQATASSYAITPKSTLLIGFSDIPDKRYIFAMAYVKRLPELLLDTDVSIISKAGYDRVLLALARAELAKIGRIAVKGDLANNAVADGEAALAEAWTQDQYAEMLKESQNTPYPKRSQIGASWIGRV